MPFLGVLHLELFQLVPCLQGFLAIVIAFLREPSKFRGEALISFSMERHLRNACSATLNDAKWKGPSWKR